MIKFDNPSAVSVFSMKLSRGDLDSMESIALKELQKKKYELISAIDRNTKLPTQSRLISEQPIKLVIPEMFYQNIMILDLGETEAFKKGYVKRYLSSSKLHGFQCSKDEVTILTRNSKYILKEVQINE